MARPSVSAGMVSKIREVTPQAARRIVLDLASGEMTERGVSGVESAVGLPSLAPPTVTQLPGPGVKIEHSVPGPRRVYLAWQRSPGRVIGFARPVRECRDQTSFREKDVRTF